MSPSGLVYVPDLITEDEESTALALIETLDFHTIEMRGQTAKRTVTQFGLKYDYGTWALNETNALPSQLEPIRDKAAQLADSEPGELKQTLVSRYPEGAGIGWHRDAPAFDQVIGVSLLSECRMRFQCGRGDERQTHALDLAPRSGYLLSGSARWAWQHSIPGTKALRYSLTFRTLRGAA